MPLAKMRRSGELSSNCWWPHQVPVRPAPDWTWWVCVGGGGGKGEFDQQINQQ
jgi:hypothetical protein